jgi:hypothetical protein
MQKKIIPTILDQQQGVVMTDTGLFIPGKFLRKMGEHISVAFSDRLIVISTKSPYGRSIRKKAVRK